MIEPFGTITGDLAGFRIQLIVDRHQHRIAKREGVWVMYCPKRGPHDLIYARNFGWVLGAIENDPTCPHDGVFFQ